MTPARGPNEYDFEVRKAQPKDPGKAQPMTYWRRVLAAIDALADGESLFFRHQDEAPTDKQLAKMRSNIASQLKRHRSGNTFELVRMPAEAGVYVYYRMKASAAADDEDDPDEETPEQAAHRRADQLAWYNQADPAQRALAEKLTSTMWQGDPSAEDPPDPEPVIEGPDPIDALEAEDDDLLAFPLQGEAPSFDDVADEVEAAIEIVEVRDNPRTFREPAPACSCWAWWQNSAVYKRGDPKAKGAHHHEACKLYSTWEALDTIAACTCDGYHRERHPKRNKGEPEDNWYQPGDWHEASCPRHLHRWKLPAADAHEPGTPFIGVCECSATNSQQPYQTTDSAILVDGRAKTSAALTLARAPHPVEAPLSAVQPTRQKGSRLCPNCGAGFASLKHKTSCKGWTEERPQ